MHKICFTETRSYVRTEYHIFKGGKIANMKKFFLSTVALCLLLSFVACTPTKDAPDEPISSDSSAEESQSVESESEAAEDTPAPIHAFFNIIKDGKTDFKIVRSYKAINELVNGTSTLNQKIESITGVALEITTDFYMEGVTEEYDPNAFEILVGNTTRAETQKVLSALPENSYTVTMEGNKLVIVGTNDELTVMAIEEFERRFFRDTLKCREGHMMFVRANDTFTMKPEDMSTFGYLVGNKYSYSCKSEHIMNSSKVNDCYVAQGACSDGTYVYFALRNSNDTAVVIKKHRLDNGQLVGQSGRLSLGHANDLAYDSKRDRIVAITDMEYDLKFIDPDKLTIIGGTTLSVKASAITYSPEQDRFAATGSDNIYILDSNFKVIGQYGRSDNTGYTSQGMGADKDCIYFIVSAEDNSDNILIIYSWRGAYIGQTVVNVALEGESVFWVNGTYYVSYHRPTKGPSLYKLTPSLTES